MADYRVLYVPDDVMGGQDFVLCNQHENGVIIYMRRGIRDLSDQENQAVWEAAWAAYRELMHIDFPRQWNSRGDTLSLGLDRRASGER